MAGTFQADSYTDSAGTGAPTFPFGMTLSAGQVLKVDTISNAAGTGAPNFNHGLTLTTAQVLQADTIANAAGTGAPNFNHGLTLTTAQVLQADTIANAAGSGAPNFNHGFTSAATSSITSGNFIVNTNNLFVDSTNNRVGINTATPGSVLATDLEIGTGVSAVSRSISIRRSAGGGFAATINFFGDNTTNPYALIQNTAEASLDFKVYNGSITRRFIRADFTGSPPASNPAVTIGDASAAGNFDLVMQADTSGGFSRSIRFYQGTTLNCRIFNPNDTSFVIETNGTTGFSVSPTQVLGGNITNWASAATQDIGFSATTGVGSFVKFTSSRRYKHDIANVSFDTQKIYDLTAKEFSWNSNNERDFGYIAEEVAAILPEIVIYATKEVERERDEEGQLIGEVEYEKVLDDHGDTMVEAVKYRQLTVLIIEEMKKLRSRIAILEQA